MARSSTSSLSAVDHATKAYNTTINPADLPRVSFRVVGGDGDSADDDDDDGGGDARNAFDRRTKADKAQLPLPLLEAFGYNVAPEEYAAVHGDHYIRHVEPIEVELANQVEYDMDEQDREWLDRANEGRVREGLDRMGYEVFEIVMDRLEKEWFSLVSRLERSENETSRRAQRESLFSHVSAPQATPRAKRQDNISY